jgi:hypothetical protein
MLQEMSTVLRRPLDLEEELRLMAQEVRDCVEAVLNSLSANIPKVRNPGPQLTNLPQDLVVNNCII